MTPGDHAATNSTPWACKSNAQKWQRNEKADKQQTGPCGSKPVTKMTARLLSLAAILLAGGPAIAEPAATICGSKPEMVGIMLRMVEDGVEKVAGDNRMFVKRDSRDGSLWVIALPNTTAHPALLCRTKEKELAMLCTAGEKACASFRQQAMERLAKVDATAAP
jgi:hypothetical protein